MSVVVAGVNHRTVPVSQLEPMAVPDARLGKALDDLASRDHLDEVVVVSTCLRTEIYATANRFHGAIADIRNFLADWSGAPPESFSDHLYSYYDDAAIAHLFRVAAGLDSAVLGEGEILRQVSSAWQAARAQSAAGSVLAGVFRHALEVGKRVRSETAIARGTTSLSQAAVALAASHLGTLEGKTTLVLGAGEMGEAMAQALSATLGSGPLLVANRTASRAIELAARCGGRAVEWGHRRDALVAADVLLASTGASETLVDVAEVQAVLADRRDRPLLVVDIAVPRDVEPAVGDLAGVTLLDMDDVASFAERGMRSRREELPRALAIVAEELDRYLGAASQRTVAPLVAALYDRAEEIRQAEMARFAGRLTGLDASQNRAVEALTRGIIAKLLHEPTVTVKQAAETQGGEPLADALRRLFGLDLDA